MDDKILRIDLGATDGPAATVEPAGDFARLGGRATTSFIVSKEVDPTCHPLSADNKLVFAPGMLTGSAASTSGRISVGCKSPLTGGIKEANAGGQAGQALARLGYRAVIVEGKPQGDDLWIIHIDSTGASFQVDNGLRMLGTYDTVARLRARYGDKVTYLLIGQAGEQQLGGASIAACDRELRPTRHLGRGGVGAVMGSKKIKAFVLDDAGTKSRRPADAEGFKEATRVFNEGLRRHGVSGEGLPAFGTNVLTNILNAAGGYPTRNFSSGSFDEHSMISGETQAETMSSRPGGVPTHPCHRGCIIQCSGIYTDADGNYISKQAEYETVWSHGGHCGISDLEIIHKLDQMDDDFGLDTIETGVAIGVAMEGGLIPFGDGEGALRVLAEVGTGTPLGKIIGSGAAVTGKAFGVSRVPVVKGQALPAYDPRAVQGIGVTYATTPMGADHTAGYCITANILQVGGFVDPLKTEGQVELSRNLQIATAALDSTGMCLFIAFPIIDQPDTFSALVETISAFYGIDYTADDYLGMGKRVLEAELDFNRRAGFTTADDRLPGFFKTEPIPPHNITFQVKDEELDSVLVW